LPDGTPSSNYYLALSAGTAAAYDNCPGYPIPGDTATQATYSPNSATVAVLDATGTPQFAETENQWSNTSSSTTGPPVPDNPEICNLQTPDGYPGNPNYSGGNSTPALVGNTTEYLWVLPTSCLTGNLPNGDCAEPYVQSRFIPAPTRLGVSHARNMSTWRDSGPAPKR